MEVLACQIIFVTGLLISKVMKASVTALDRKIREKRILMLSSSADLMQCP